MTNPQPDNPKIFADPATMPTYETKRLTVPSAEALIGVPLRCLDKGFVRLVDYMGGDARVVQSARVSYGEGTKTIRDDAALIDYLIRNAHTSPIEQVETVTHWKLPIFVARQIVRTRTASLNEESARYSILGNEFWVPSLEELRAQSSTNKQMSGEVLPRELAEKLLAAIVAEQQSGYTLYEELLRQGLSREVARIVLDAAVYTEWYWKIDAKNLIDTLRLRDDSHAQPQTQAYARAMKEVLRAVAPQVYASADEHVWGAARFGRSERQALADMLDGVECRIEGGARDRFVAKLAIAKPNPLYLPLERIGFADEEVMRLDGHGIRTGGDLVECATRGALRSLFGDTAEDLFRRADAAGLVLRGW
ncbi:Thymidylate synthase ThyX [compost metagenome]